MQRLRFMSSLFFFCLLSSSLLSFLPLRVVALTTAELARVSLLLFFFVLCAFFRVYSSANWYLATFYARVCNNFQFLKDDEQFVSQASRESEPSRTASRSDCSAEGQPVVPIADC
jgi:hypothetical protein